MRSALFLAAVALGLSACSNDAYFTLGRDPQVCEDSIPTACGSTARCVLDTGHYIKGDFPSGRRFIVRTMGEADLRFEIYLDNRKAPGTSLRLEVAEPSCNEKQTYDSAGVDIFKAAGEDGILVIPIHVARPGDHLVELSADAYCAYTLKFSMTTATP